ncbi:unnamed protein product [Protopolystoma xenopodis]|uniref:Uncharacterized protein n=1 Tax=Protopolystoma xenopodis TaxID=117903 RepID=A0A3S5AMH4_9PLAT|nr:unnamed protein product [Protopolystoma xenopodis]
MSTPSLSLDYSDLMVMPGWAESGPGKSGLPRPSGQPAVAVCPSWGQPSTFSSSPSSSSSSAVSASFFASCPGAKRNCCTAPPVPSGSSASEPSCSGQKASSKTMIQNCEELLRPSEVRLDEEASSPALLDDVSQPRVTAYHLELDDGSGGPFKKLGPKSSAIVVVMIPSIRQWTWYILKLFAGIVVGIIRMAKLTDVAEYDASETFENAPNPLSDAGNHDNYYGRQLRTRVDCSFDLIQALSTPPAGLEPLQGSV